MTTTCASVEGPAPPDDLPPIIAHSKAAVDAVLLARRFAPTDLPILLIGPTGCGKELLAQHIHHWSGRRGEVVDVNCAAIPESLIESELFGHGPTAFTGARQTRRGLIEQADGKTFFLDEISGLPWVPQGKLLRVIETREVRRLGENQKRLVDVRFLAAAQDDLPGLIARGRFREDLYHRLAGVVIRLPSLAERLDDLPVLAAHFATRLGAVLAPGAERALLQYPWPGNVRELRMVVERARCLSATATLSADTLFDSIALGALPAPPHWELGSAGLPHPVDSLPSEIRCSDRQPPRLEESLTRAERTAILGALAFTRGDRDRAAELLGISRATLYRRLARLGGL